MCTHVSIYIQQMINIARIIEFFYKVICISDPKPVHLSGTGEKYLSMASRNLFLYKSG